MQSYETKKRKVWCRNEQKLYKYNLVNREIIKDYKDQVTNRQGVLLPIEHFKENNLCRQHNLSYSVP